MTSIANFYERIDRQPWREGADGIWWIPVYRDDVIPIDIDLTDVLGGTTVSTVSWESSGVTVSNESNDTSGFSAHLSGVGTAKVSVVYADARKYNRIWRLRGIDVVQHRDYLRRW